MTLLVRNEQDIIAENIRFHHALGVDSFIVMDNLSTDATPRIVKALSEEIEIDYLHQPRDDYNQWEWVTEMARRAAVDHRADWVINNDADEFWVPRGGDLKQVLAALPAETGALRVARHNAVLLCDSGAPLTGRSHPATSHVFERESTNALGKPLPGKVLHRACPGVTVAQGNHGVSDVPGATEAAGERLRILHYPYRALDQYKDKIRLGGAAYARNTALPPNAGGTWRAHYQDLETGALDRFWAELSLTPEEVTIGLLTGRLFREETVADFLAARKSAQRQDRMRAATGALIDRTRALTEEFSAHYAQLIERVERRERWNRPMYYNLRFAANGAQAHLHRLEELTARPEPEALCAALPALRDAFSLFPRNTHLRPFLRELLGLARAEEVARLRADCAGKRVILHTSCQPRLTASEETLASFDAMTQEGYHHIILLGDPQAGSEEETGLSFGYDGRILRVPAPDSYEQLHRKLFYAYMLFDLLTEPEMVVKIDDNLVLEEAARFTACLDRVAAENAAYAGRRVGADRHETQWHGWHLGKCADPVIEARGYQYPLPREYAAGGFGYVLGRAGLAACGSMYLSMKAFFAMDAVGLEDACAGHAAYAQGLELLDITEKGNILTLPGLTTKERRRLIDGWAAL